MTNDLYLVYAGKPTHGDGKIFTSLSPKVKNKRYLMIFKTIRKTIRPYGYDCGYQNTTVM